jgi:hypothetical protein
LAVRVPQINRIVGSVGIKVYIRFIPHRVGLQEPAERRRVDPRFVIPHVELGEPRLAGIAEPPDIAGVGDAPGVVGVDRDRVAVLVGDRDDRALVVGVEEPSEALPVLRDRKNPSA